MKVRKRENRKEGGRTVVPKPVKRVIGGGALGAGLLLGGCGDETASSTDSARPDGRTDAGGADVLKPDGLKSDKGPDCLATTKAVVTANVSKDTTVNSTTCKAKAGCETPLQIGDKVSLDGNELQVSDIKLDANGTPETIVLKNTSYTVTVTVGSGSVGSCVVDSKSCSKVFSGQSVQAVPEKAVLDQTNYQGRAVVLVTSKLAGLVPLFNLVVLDEGQTKTFNPAPGMNIECSVTLKKGLDGKAYVAATYKVGGKIQGTEVLGVGLTEGATSRKVGGGEMLVGVLESVDNVNSKCNSISAVVNVDGHDQAVNDGDTLVDSRLKATLVVDTAKNTAWIGVADRDAKTYENERVAFEGKVFNVDDSQGGGTTVVLKTGTAKVTSK